MKIQIPHWLSGKKRNPSNELSEEKLILLHIFDEMNNKNVLNTLVDATRSKTTVSIIYYGNSRTIEIKN